VFGGGVRASSASFREPCAGTIDVVDEPPTFRPARAGDILEDDPLRDWFVWWDQIGQSDLDSFSVVLEQASDERAMQSYLESHPKMLVQHLGGGHGRWVLPQRRLGSQHVPDFLVGDRDSSGRRWTAVELEGPQRSISNRNGDPSAVLWHSIRQILDWRIWLTFNLDYARRDPADAGLGLEDISPSLPGLIIIGRRTNQGRPALRRALEEHLRIEIHSYDWLLERAQGRVRALRSLGQQRKQD
jgi:Domain of unknown function (DUF4263)